MGTAWTPDAGDVVGYLDARAPKMSAPELLADLGERLVAADRLLLGLAERELQRGDVPECLRLTAKASGVRMALSYLRDYR